MRRNGNASSATKSRFFRPTLEMLERREVLDATVSGTVVQTLNVAGLFPKPSATLFGPVSGVTVTLDGGVQTDTTDVNGDYSFTIPSISATGAHTLVVTLPAGFLGFSAQALSYTVNLVDGQTFSSLNFALTPTTDALAQNLFELVLNRPADFNGFNSMVSSLTGGGTVGQAFASLYNSAEFKQISQPVAWLIESFFPGPLNVGLFRRAVEIQNLGITQDAAVLDLFNTSAFVDAHGDVSAAGLSDSAYVSFLFQELLSKNPTQNQLNKYVAELEAGTNRGQLALEIVGLKAFKKTQVNDRRRVGISLAYLGVLGREATQSELNTWVQRMKNGLTITQVANRLSNTTEFDNLAGFTSTVVWDVKTHQIKPAADPLSRLQLYNPTTQQFDTAVAAGSLTSTSGSPSNVYFISHGWAPGLLEPVLLNSTPGNPFKSWETAGTANADPDWLYSPTNQVSAEGLAQAIIDKDPLAKVVAWSWIDLSATALGDDAVQVTLTGQTNGNTTISNVDTSKLFAGMTVSGAGIPPNTVIMAITSQTAVSISQAATTSQSGVSLTFTGENLAKGIEQFMYAGQSEGRTQLAGLMLAEAIQEALSPTFFGANEGLIHLLGHSHGSKVATIASLALQNDGVPVSHLTLFESPEAGPTFFGTSLHASGLGGAENFNWYFLQQMSLSRTPVTGSRVGGTSTFVDNYFSAEGFGSAIRGYTGLSSVVDVLLHPESLYGQLSITDVQADATILFDSHDYPPGWYGQASLQNPNGPANTLNGLNWSPLINAGTAATLDGFYEQPTQPTPGQFVQTQFELNGSNPAVTTTPTFTALAYAQQFEQGNVTDNGTSMTLSVDGTNPRALNTVVFAPLSIHGTPTPPSGTGIDFEFTFNGITAGEQVELVIWVYNMASVLQDGLTQPLGGTVGFISIPLFNMDGATAGDAVTHKATMSLDMFREGLLFGPMNSVVNNSSPNPTPIVPTMAFQLVGANGATGSVTVTSMNQFADGIS